ncbi:hypothetical protein [Rhizobium sp. RCC_161_2]|uniref:hypothetical protein n=1 Tax=Rhizobium sp. RCC_161_2 TaxID=3239219 RepID=UPI0035232A62
MMKIAARYGGLTIAPLVWAINTQLGLILPHVDCHSRARWSVVASAGAVFLVMVSVAVSGAGSMSGEPRTRLFVRYLSIVTGLVFAFALILQGEAAWLFYACEH